MPKRYFKLSALAILIFLSVLILGVAIHAGILYLVYGVLLSMAFPELPQLSFLQYVAVGTAMMIIMTIFKR